MSMRALGGAGIATTGDATARRDRATERRVTTRASARSSPTERREALRRREALSRPSTRAFGAPAPTPRVAIGALDGRGGARRVAARAAEGRVEQLERQVREDPVTPSTPSVGDDARRPSDARVSGAAKTANVSETELNGAPSKDTRETESDSDSRANREPLSPGRRFLLKARLTFLLSAAWTVKFFKSLFASRAFAFFFAVFVAASAALGARAVAARRSALRASAPRVVLYSAFVKDLAAKKVKQVRFEEGTSRILYELADGGAARNAGSSADASTRDKKPGGETTSRTTKNTKNTVLQTKRIPDEKLMSRMEAAGVDFGSVAAPPSSYLSKGALTAMALWIPLVPLYFIMRNMANKQGGGDAAKKAKSRGAVDDAQRVTFADVAGVDEAKAELVELVEMLKSAEKYARVRSRLPTGCLLVGPPGTGKTLLAKAVAGEANVPFFSVAASEFVELFVGRGAARVRELFAEARKNAPAVIFIDELDAIGARRGAGLNEERDQTLNQMLVEMDGFNKPGGVLVLAATNRAEALDPALLRPGRLTRRVFVGPPDAPGRARILRVHLRGVETSASLETTCESVARVTPGFTGAELANVVNEACLLAARDDREVVDLDDLIKGAERTRDGVGVGKGAASVLSRLRELVARNDGWGGGGPGDGGFGGPGGGGPENVAEGNRKQGVGLSMPPT
jgi:ATP-dependent Zn protease